MPGRQSMCLKCGDLGHIRSSCGRVQGQDRDSRPVPMMETQTDVSCTQIETQTDVSCFDRVEQETQVDLPAMLGVSQETQVNLPAVPATKSTVPSTTTVTQGTALQKSTVTPVTGRETEVVTPKQREERALRKREELERRAAREERAEQERVFMKRRSEMESGQVVKSGRVDTDVEVESETDVTFEDYKSRCLVITGYSDYSYGQVISDHLYKVGCDHIHVASKKCAVYAKLCELRDVHKTIECYKQAGHKVQRVTSGKYMSWFPEVFSPRNVN